MTRREWRATFYTTGMEHSPTSATGIRDFYDSLNVGTFVPLFDVHDLYLP